MPSKPRLSIVTTVPMSFAAFLFGQPRMLAAHYDVELICGDDGRGFERRVEAQEGIRPRFFPLTRTISPGADARAVAKLAAHYRRTRPDVVQTYTPKAGLVGMAAARLACVPTRVHGVLGMPLMEADGTRGVLLHAAELATYANATHVTANSTGLREWMWTHLTTRPITVIANGSVNGLDPVHFSDTLSADGKRARRRALGIADDAVVFLFVGRVVRDKGVEELLRAFDDVARRAPNVHLLMVGDFEPELDPVSPRAEAVIRSHPNVTLTGFVDDVRPYMALSDVFVLPSYREGLPNSLLEAGGMGMAAVATDINGCNEVVEDGVNGLLVPPKDAAALGEAMARVATNHAERRAFAAAARPRAIARYGQADVFWPELLRTYERFRAERT